MAGLGARLFPAFSKLTSAQVNGFLMDQTIMRFASVVVRDAAFGGAGEPTLAEGMFCYLDDTNVLQSYTGSAWVSVASSNATNTSVAIFQEQKASGSGGGGIATIGSFAKRLLTDTVINNITGCSIASSVITLTAGSYRVQAVAPFFRLSSVQLKIRNTTASTDLCFGNTMFGDTASNGGFTPATLDGFFTLTASTTIELQYFAAGPSINTNDLGVGATTGTINVFGSLTVTKVA